MGRRTAALSAGGDLNPQQQRLLRQRLAGLRQGDVLSVGATSIVGRGPSPTLRAADPEARPPGDRPWSMMLVSHLGWYVVLSQDCDIVREMDVEPCLMICPLEERPTEYWQALRSGPYSPREFPFPEQDHLGLPAGTAPVANIRFVASLDKAALLSERFDHIAALRSAPLQERFATWLGRRSARAPHGDAVERDVLGPCGDRITQLAKAFRRSSSGRSLAQLLVGSADEWFLAPGRETHPLPTDHHCGQRARGRTLGHRGARLQPCAH